MDIFRHGIIILSVKASDKSFSDFVFDNPNKTAYGVNEALEDIKAALIEQGTEFKTFAYNTDFKDGQGSFSLQTELKPAETDFYYTLVAEGKKLLIWLLYLTVTVMMKIRHLNFGTAKHF